MNNNKSNNKINKIDTNFDTFQTRKKQNVLLQPLTCKVNGWVITQARNKPKQEEHKKESNLCLQKGDVLGN